MNRGSRLYNKKSDNVIVRDREVKLHSSLNGIINGLRRNSDDKYVPNYASQQNLQKSYGANIHIHP